MSRSRYVRWRERGRKVWRWLAGWRSHDGLLWYSPWVRDLPKYALITYKVRTVKQWRILLLVRETAAFIWGKV